MSFTQATKIITSIGQWSKAFKIYTSMYCEAEEYRFDWQDMNTYAQNIEHMASKGGGIGRHMTIM